MTIYFFVGSEFSSADTVFQDLNQGVEQIKQNDEKIIFLSAWELSLDEIAKNFQPGDVIIGASAGGTAAASLAKKVIASGKPKPLIIGFEAVSGLGEIDGVMSINQADNPKQIHYDNHVMYQLQDGNYEQMSGKKRYVYGHAFYAVHPDFVGRIQYSKETLSRVGNSAYVIIPEASLTVGSKTYTYNNLIAKTKDTKSLELATKGSRVFQIELIYNIVTALRSNTLDNRDIIPGLSVKAISSLKKKLVESSGEAEKDSNAKSNGEDYPKLVEQLIQLVKEYQNNSSSEKACLFSNDMMRVLDPQDASLLPEVKITNFYRYLIDATQRDGTFISNMDYMKNTDTSRSMLRFFAGIAAVLVIALTFPVSVPVVAIIYKKTGRSPLDLFNTHVEQLSKEIELLVKKKLPLNFFSSIPSNQSDIEPEVVKTLSYTT